MKHETIRACSIWRALDVVGDVAVLLILEQAFLGRHRFDDFVKQTGLARSVVSGRLAKLVEAGVLRKAAQRQAGYALTEKGRGLFPVALMILRWQHRWEPGERGFSVRLVHRGCGQAMEPVPHCAACQTEIDPRAVDWAPGPGLAQVTPVYTRRRQQTAAASAKRGNQTMVDSVIELFGDRWATLVVRACFTGIHRFDDIQRDTLMATNILSGRIEQLLAQRIIKAVPYSAHQDRFEYRLTEKGRDLYPVLLALLQWGDRWFADEQGPPLLLTHRNCGQPLGLQPKCSACAAGLDIRNTAFEL
ncbi:winged helix-turn-helix transcriptional regulator [Novosphingobium sp. B 225]|uniref:winged helix-turn-helix transcriptional regulator n=1 Tax=Novosphingobium sp. B 225 TaxID=1961849 RepID=UPI0020CBF692|nr:helix-turn-helix domain-containing protein [Novosphingobium sp. B 225]